MSSTFLFFFRDLRKFTASGKYEKLLHFSKLEALFIYKIITLLIMIIVKKNENNLHNVAMNSINKMLVQKIF